MMLLLLYYSLCSITNTLRTLYMRNLSILNSNTYLNTSVSNTGNLTMSTSKYTLDYDIVCLIFGSVLGDSCMTKRKKASGSVMQLTQGADNYAYLLFIWNVGLGSPHKGGRPSPKGLVKAPPCGGLTSPPLHDRGLTTDRVPVIYTRRTGYGISSYAKFVTYTLPSLNWIYYSFYETHSCMEYSFQKGTFKLTTSKRVPYNIGDYLSPLALAVWFMDDGHKASNTYVISTQSYNLADIYLLCKVLYEKHGIMAHPQKQRDKKQLMLDGSLCYIPQYVLYISTASAPLFRSIVLPHIIPSMRYKLDGR